MLELNRIYCENNLETMARMPDNFLDLTVTSPPYDNLRTYNGYSFDFESIAKELFRVTKQGGVVVWVVGDATIKGSESGTSFRQALYFKEIGFNLHDTMIYSRFSMPSTAKRYAQDFEYMFVFSKEKPKTSNLIKVPCRYAGIGTSPTSRDKTGTLVGKGGRVIKNEKKESNIWHYSAGAGKSTKDTVAHEHPAIFPERLANDHIISWSNEGDLVYDPFMGSGTTAKMALKNGRNFIGSEISAEYCAIAESRIAKAQSTHIEPEDNARQDLSLFPAPGASA